MGTTPLASEVEVETVNEEEDEEEDNDDEEEVPELYHQQRDPNVKSEFLND